MKCPSCESVNPSEAKFCLKCGAGLGTASPADPPPAQPGQYPTAHVKGILAKMLETPGTTLLTIGVIVVLVSIVVGVLEHWLAAIALFAVSVTLLYFAVQLRNHETRAPAHRTEVREREIVKIKCRYCGALNPDGARNCGSCGAVL